MAQARQVCIFCSKPGLTKEHFWPEWASDLLPDSNAYDIVRNTNSPNMTVVTKPGAVKTRKIRVVCGKCNSGWMSVLETAVRPILTPMIVGKPLKLTRDDQRTLVSWVALKVIVLEHTNREAAVVTQVERASFYKGRTIPSNMRIRIGICGEGPWKSAVVNEASALSLLSATSHLHPPKGKNIQTTTFGIGDLLIHVSVCNVPGLDIDDLVPVDKRVYRLWPPSSEELDWPHRQAFIGNEAAAVLCQRIAIARDRNRTILLPAPSRPLSR